MYDDIETEKLCQKYDILYTALVDIVGRGRVSDLDELLDIEQELTKRENR